MTIDLSGLPRRVSLSIGERLEIPLPSYVGSGNTWSAICLRGDDVARVSVLLGDLPPLPPIRADGVVEPPALMLVPEFAVVEGLAYGEANWRLALARSFDPSNPAAVHDLDITVCNGLRGAIDHFTSKSLPAR
jgi:hypothetical protein